MRTWLAQYGMRDVATLQDALSLLSSEPGEWMPFAGGTDLMVLLEAGRLPRRRFMNIWGIDVMRGISPMEDGVRIGALTTYTDLLNARVIAEEFPLIAEAARQTGAVAIQNRGTIGGNIANGSPAADLPPALLVYDAMIEVASTRGARLVPYDVFHRGYKVMDLAADELIVAVIVPRRRAVGRQVYRKVGTRRAQAISKVCFAASAQIDDGTVGDVRIALGSVAPTVVRARRAEEALRGRQLTASVVAEARSALSSDISPIDDIRSTAPYRRLVAGNLLEEFLT